MQYPLNLSKNEAEQKIKATLFIGGKQLKCHYLLQKSFTFFYFCQVKWHFIQETDADFTGGLWCTVAFVCVPKNTTNLMTIC